MLSFTLAETILTFIGIVAVGVLLRRSGLVTPEDTRPLNAIIIYVGLPAFVFQAVHGAALQADLLVLVAVAWASFAVALAAAWLVVRLLRLPPTTAGAFLLAASLGNTGYIGYPVTRALLGEQAVAGAVFFDVFGTVFALVLVGLPIAQRYGASGRRLSHPVRELVTFPAVVALFVALLLRPFAVPEALSNGLDLCASMVAPLIMLSVGIALRPRAIAGFGAPLLAASGIRLVLAPLVAVLLGSLVLQEAGLRVATLEAGMPTMMLTLVVGERFGLDRDMTASAIFVTTALAAITLPLWQSLPF
jgi:hypothetical protein